MNRVWFVLSATLTVVFVVSGAGQRAVFTVPRSQDRGDQNLNQEVSDEILISFLPGIDPDVVARSVGARVHSHLDRLGVHVLKVPPGSVQGTLHSLTSNPLVEFAEPNGYVHAFALPNDPYVSAQCYWASSGQCVTQWAWAKVHAYDAWNITTGSPSVRVAVVDTRIDVGNPNYYWWPDYPDLGSTWTQTHLARRRLV